MRVRAAADSATTRPLGARNAAPPPSSGILIQAWAAFSMTDLSRGFKRLSADEAANALYIDFEGEKDRAPVLLGTLRVGYHEQVERNAPQRASGRQALFDQLSGKQVRGGHSPLCFNDEGRSSRQVLNQHVRDSAVIAVLQGRPKLELNVGR